MSSEGHDWQIVMRQRVRRQAAWLLIIGAVLLINGWGLLGVYQDGGFRHAVSNAYVWTNRVGGVLFVALAGASLTGWRIWLVIDAAATAAVAALVGLYAVVAFVGGYLFDGGLQAIFAAVLGSATVSAIRAFRATDLIGWWGQRTDLDFSSQSTPAPPDAPARNAGRSLAGELLQRTRRTASPGSGPVPVIEPKVSARPPDEGSGTSPLPAVEPVPSPSTAKPGLSRAPQPQAAPDPPQPVKAPEGFLAALAREEEPPGPGQGG